MTDTIIHYGILGQKWGLRRYQNEDGTLTSAGKKRYGNTQSDGRNKNVRSYVYNRLRSSSNPYFNNSSISGGGGYMDESIRTKDELEPALTKLQIEENDRKKFNIPDPASKKSPIDKGKEIVDKILKTTKAAVTKIKDVSSSLLNDAKSLVKKVLNIQDKTEWKRITSTTGMMVKANEGTTSSKANIAPIKEASSVDNKKKKK